MTDRRARYDAQHTRQIVLKLNRRTDSDILRKLDEQPNKQGYIKRLVRADIKFSDFLLPEIIPNNREKVK